MFDRHCEEPQATKQSDQLDCFAPPGLAMTVFIWLLLFACSPVFASVDLPDSTSLLTKAEEALRSGSKKKADFYVTRYLTLCSTGSEQGCSSEALQTFLKKRQLVPKSFISADWDPGFLDWFGKAPRELWSVQDDLVREKFRSFEISRATYEGKNEKRYFVSVVAYPELELWHFVENGVFLKPLLLTVGSWRDRPVVFFGKVFKDQPSFQSSSVYLDTQRRTLQYVWKPEFFDLDGDQMPEIWIRYNISWGSGYSQILDIYKIKDERELVFLKRFQGVPEGIARRLPDGRVEAASRVSVQSSTASTPEDKHHQEIWEYVGGEFRKTAEEDIPNILNTPQWAEYFANSPS